MKVYQMTMTLKLPYYRFKGWKIIEGLPEERMWEDEDADWDDEFLVRGIECKNCLYYGMYGNVFVGFCWNCAYDDEPHFPPTHRDEWKGTYLEKYLDSGLFEKIILDVVEWAKAIRQCATFKQELIETTWQTKRVKDWCLDIEEVDELFENE